MAYEVRNEYYRAAKRHLAVCLQLQNNLLEIKKDFEVFGLKDDQWHTFRKDIEYKAFLIKRKK